MLAHLAGDATERGRLPRRRPGPWKTNPQVDHLIGRKLSQNYRFAEGLRLPAQGANWPTLTTSRPDPARQDLLRLGKDDEGWRPRRRLRGRPVRRPGVQPRHAARHALEVPRSADRPLPRPAWTRARPSRLGTARHPLAQRAAEGAAARVRHASPTSAIDKVRRRNLCAAARRTSPSAPSACRAASGSSASVSGRSSPSTAGSRGAAGPTLGGGPLARVLPRRHAHARRATACRAGSAKGSASTRSGWSPGVGPGDEPAVPRADPGRQPTPVSKLERRGPFRRRRRRCTSSSPITNRRWSSSTSSSASADRTPEAVLLTDLGDDVPINVALAEPHRADRAARRQLRQVAEGEGAERLAPGVSEPPSAPSTPAATAMAAWNKEHPEQLVRAARASGTAPACERNTPTRTPLEAATALYPTYGEAGGP